MENKNSVAHYGFLLDTLQSPEYNEDQSTKDEELDYFEDLIIMIKKFSDELIECIKDLELKTIISNTEQMWSQSKWADEYHDLWNSNSSNSKKKVYWSKYKKTFDNLKKETINFYNSLKYPELDHTVIQAFLENRPIAGKLKILNDWMLNTLKKGSCNKIPPVHSETISQFNFLPFQSHNEIYSMKFFDGKVVTGGNDEFLRQWDIANSTHEIISTKHKNFVTILRFSHTKRLWASADKDGMVCIWKNSSKRAFFKFSSAHKREIKFLKFSRDDRFCFCATKNQVLVWDLETNKKVKKISEKDGVHSLSVSDKFLAYTTCKFVKILGSDNDFAEVSLELKENLTIAKICDNICLSAGKFIYILDLNTKTLLKTLEKHQFCVKKLKVFKNFFISCGADNFIGIWDRENYKIKIVLHNKYPLTDIKILDNDLYALSASKTLVSWNLENFQPNFSLQVASPIKSVAFDESKNMILALHPNIIKIYDIQSEKWKTEFLGHCDAILIVLIKNDFSGFVSADNKDVIFWDIKLNKTEKICDCHSFINCMALTPNDEFLVTAGEDSRIVVWKVENKGVFCVFETKTLRVKQVCCTNELVFSSAEDGVINVWNLKEKRWVFKIESCINKVFDLIVSNDEKTLVVVGRNQAYLAKISFLNPENSNNFYILTNKKDLMIEFCKFAKDCTEVVFKNKVLDQHKRNFNQTEDFIKVNLKQYEVNPNSEYYLSKVYQSP